MYAAALALWAAFLLVAVFYTRHERNRRMRPLAAYLIFVTAFTMASFVVFAAIIIVLGAFNQERALDSPLAAAIMLFVVFVPAFFVARWLIRKPPQPPVRP
jgi:cytochrome bd-type quinol oxidase subunit 2